MKHFIKFLETLKELVYQYIEEKEDAGLCTIIAWEHKQFEKEYFQENIDKFHSLLPEKGYDHWGETGEIHTDYCFPISDHKKTFFENFYYHRLQWIDEQIDQLNNINNG